MEAIQTLKLAGKDVPLYELTGTELPHFVNSRLAVTADAVYAPTQEKGEDDAHLWKFPMKGDKLSVLIREGNYFIKVKELKFEPVETVPDETRFVVRY